MKTFLKILICLLLTFISAIILMTVFTENELAKTYLFLLTVSPTISINANLLNIFYV